MLRTVILDWSLPLLLRLKRRIFVPPGLPPAPENPRESAMAVDPSRLAFARLLYNFHANPSAKVTPLELALADRAGTLDMELEWRHAGARPDSAAGSPSLRQVSTLAADPLCADKGIAPGTIKIDVEGREVRVLRGLRQTLATARSLLFIEVHPGRIAALGDSLAELVRLLTDARYALRDLDGVARPFADLLGRQDDSRWIVEPA